MKKKIIGFFVCMLMITPAVPVIGTLNDRGLTSITTDLISQSLKMNNWTEVQKLLASDGTTEDYFGYSVSLSGDTALIGAYYDDYPVGNSGSAYVFLRSGTTWILQAKLQASDGAQNDYFGNSVSLDGNTALIGAYQNDNEHGANSGSAYVFVRTGSTWTQQAKLLGSDEEAYDNFAYSVSLYGDTVLIGSPLDDDNAEGSGSVYVFTRAGTSWSQQQKIIAPDPGMEDLFGCSVSLSGNTALIGASRDDGQGTDSGSAYVFTRTGTSWSYQAKLISLDNAAGDTFGCSVSLSEDTALIGAHYKDYGTGAAYIFIRIGISWIQQTKLPNLEIGPGDNFGKAVALYGDTALVSAYLYDHSGPQTGSAYVYNHIGTTWTQDARLLASDGALNDFFGYSVSLYDNTALIGAWGDDDHGENSGSAYVFVLDTGNTPPDKPTINGFKEGKVGDTYTYTFVAIDPENDNLYYEIDWGDGVVDDPYGPVESNEIIQRSHKWYQKGTFTIKARAKDIYGAIGEWGTLTVTMPCSYTIPIQQLDLKKLFMIYINGTGETAIELEEIDDGFKFLLIFDFINAEAELKLGRFGLPLWEWFPYLFNHIGPQRYQVIWFFGNIQKIDDNVYHIEGYCTRISGRSLS